MHVYAQETFSPEERDVLRRYFTNLDGPVFALVNLPDVVKGALFARYSRSSKSLRRLFLDEFAGDLDLRGDQTVDATRGLERADQLYQRIFVEYGDDSVAQLGGVHLACEQASNLLTKILERGRLMSYLEQSTRYLSFDRRLPNGHYRFYRDEELLESRHGARVVGEMDRMFDTYAELVPRLIAWLRQRFPQSAQDTDLVYRQAIRAKAFDALRGLLPAAALSNLGMYGSGQAYEHLLLRLRAHPLPEARAYGALIQAELAKVIPSFLRRLDIPERGGAWVEYLEQTRQHAQGAVHALETASPVPSGPTVRLVRFDADGERAVLAAIAFEHGAASYADAKTLVDRLEPAGRAALLAAYVGERRNRRHRPGRAFEATTYTFEVVSDYGAFRDLQRHRLATVEWQALNADLGYETPDLVREAGLAVPYQASLERSGDLYHELRDEFPLQAQYAVALAFHIRYAMTMNLREALHVIELRSGPQGHPNYRRIAHQMLDLIGDQAGHRLLAATFTQVDTSETDLERLEAERRAERARAETRPAT